MDKLIEKIKNQSKKRGTNLLESPSLLNNSSIGEQTPSDMSYNQKKYPRVCVDFRYLSDQIGQETTEELRTVKK